MNAPAAVTATQSRTPGDVTLTVRRPQFDFSTLPKYWFEGSPWKTHFGTALMLVFPSGEDFVVGGVRRYRDRITDARLKQEVARFCGQEGFHSREHDRLNEFLFSQGYAQLRNIATQQRRSLEWFARVLPHKFQLSLSASIEHLTSSFGHQALAQKDDHVGMHPVVRELLLWHAVEEMEHKSVCFDVDDAMGGSHFMRVLGLMAIVPMVLLTTWGIFLYLLAADGRLFDLRMWWNEFVKPQAGNLGRVLRGRKPAGIMGALPRDVLLFIRPRFHPWDIDDRHLIAGFRDYDPMRALANGGSA